MRKVLIIDDDQAILEAMQLALEDAGYAVKTLSDSNRVIPIVHQYNPDIILLDLLLSGNDGTKIIAEVRSDDTYKAIPIILLSAHPTAEQTAKLSGATDFLAKPFDIDALIGKVQQYIGE